MVPHWYQVQLSSMGARLSPRRIHKMLMAALPDDLTGLLPAGVESIGPRADAGLLWFRQGDAVIVTIRSGLEFMPSGPFITAVTELNGPKKGVDVEFSILMTRQYRASVGYVPVGVKARLGDSWKKYSTGRLVPVEEDRVVGWAKDRLRRVAPDVTGMTVNIQNDYLLAGPKDSRVKVPVVTARATAPWDQWLELVVNGVGRAKNYGLGLAVPVSFLM